MILVRLLRLLLEVYGALFLLIVLVGMIFQGLMPYQAFLELGTLRFYFLLASGFVLWLGVAAYILRRPGN